MPPKRKLDDVDMMSNKQIPITSCLESQGSSTTPEKHISGEPLGLTTPPLHSQGKWSNRAMASKSRTSAEGISPMDLGNNFVEEDHIEMGNLVDGNAFVHVYKMKFPDEEFEFIPYIICGDQKLSYYLKYGGMPDKAPYYPQSTDDIEAKQLFPKVKPLIDYENVYVPKREIKNRALNEVYVEKGSPPLCLKFAGSESLQNTNTKWFKGTLMCIDVTNTPPPVVTTQLQVLSEISYLPGYYNPTPPKSERFIPHGVQRKYEGRVVVIEHYINDEAADWMECFMEKIKNGCSTNKKTHLVEKIFCYRQISLLKEFRGSISGDGPPQQYNNGLTVRRNRSTRRFEIHSIDHDILSALIPNYSCQIGDTVVELNGVNITNMSLPEVNGILRREALNAIYTMNISNRHRATQAHIGPSIPILNRSFNQLLQGALALNGFTVRRYPHPRASPLRIDEINENFSQIHPEIQHDIRGFVVIQVGQLQIQTETIAINVMRYLNENVAVNLRTRPVNVTDISNEQMMHNDQIRATARYQSVQQLWDYNRPCVFCGCLFLKSENTRSRNYCCDQDRLNHSSEMPELGCLPPILKATAVNNIEHFSRNSVSYNSVLSLGATGVENHTPDHPGWERIHGDHAVKLHGRTYHYVPRTNSRGGIQYFTFDALDSMLEHATELNTTQNGVQVHTRIIPQVAESLYRELQRINTLVQECHQIGIYATLTNEENSRTVRPAINGTTSFLDVAAITADRTTGNRIIRYHRKNQLYSSDIQMTDCLMEPLCYVLLFPYGNGGWGADMRKTLRFNDYLCCRMVRPERNHDGTLLRMFNKAKTRQIPVNRFQVMSRLGQTYLVDMVSRIIDFRLQWHKINQDLFGIAQNENGNNVDDENDDTETKTFLSQSFHGSRRHLRMLATNALTIVSEMGRPTIFLTLTCNIHWTEIEDQLLDGQTAYDRPDIVCRVFKARLDALLSNLRHGKYFGSHRVGYEIRVIEYQRRGLPHAHAVFQLLGVPDHKDKQNLVNWIDKYISAESPNPTSDSVDPEQINRHNLYVHHISSSMTHKCYSASQGGCLSQDGKCKRGYDSLLCVPTTSFDEKGFPIYRRRTQRDLRIVPNNMEIVIDWDGHACAEYSGSVYTVIYLYKYLFKGASKASLRLTNADDVSDKDELTLYIRGRYLCSVDAMWRTLGYQTYPSPDPSVYVIKAKLPADVEELSLKNKCCDLLIYFNRPNILHHLKFTDFLNEYKWGYNLGVRHRNENLDTSSTCFRIVIQNINKPVFIWKRDPSNRSITRMEMIYITAGEIWYLRILLLHRACVSFVDLRTVHGVAHRTFQEAAVAMGLVNSQNEVLLCFRDVMQISTPNEKRGLFFTLTMQGYPTINALKDPEIKSALIEDILVNNGHRLELAYQELLTLLSERLQDQGKSMSMYGLPEPAQLRTELERYQIYHDVESEMREYTELVSTIPNNEQQQEIFDMVARHIQEETRVFLFVDGKGGTGKTTLAKKLMAYTRGHGKIALGSASTALAATLYKDFETTHSLFKFPVVEEQDKDPNLPTECLLSRHPQRLELLRATTLFVFDEFPSLDREVFEGIYKEMKQFQNKVVVCLGDFRQLPPVIEGGDRAATVNASIKSSPLWNFFRIMRLNLNMRLLGLNTRQDQLSDDDAQDLENQKNFAQILDHIGNGTHPQSVDDEFDGTGAQIIPMSFVKCFQTEEEGINFIYPNGHNPVYMHNRAILAATNKMVDEWNTKIQDMNPAPLLSLYSVDKLCEVDDPHNTLRSMLSEEVLNNFNHSGNPPHKLNLKINDICIVLRNLNKKAGLTNNTRVIIIHISRFVIKVRTLNQSSSIHLIPRIHFKFRLPFGQSYQLSRKQFPLRLAYCISINKSQGQELSKVLCDFRVSPFTHGHTYVSATRVRHHNDLAYIVDPNSFPFEPDVPYINNVVYPELLL